MRAKRVEPLPVLPTDVRLTMTVEEARLLVMVLTDRCKGRVIFGKGWAEGNVVYDVVIALTDATYD